jgi:inorganic triphosphatase YgiF
MSTEERELKLVPEHADMLDELAQVERLGPFVARGRRHELQRNSFYDSAAHGLEHVHVGFRRRRVEGQPSATWTIKGDSSHIGGVATRSEVELQLPADVPPAEALNALRDSARTRGAGPLAEALDEALAKGAPLPIPFVETLTNRRIVDLEAPDRGWEVELALDRMEVVDHAYSDLEIEAELKRGDEAALDAARAAIATLGLVHNSEGSKLSRAAAHVADCDCKT